MGIIFWELFIIMSGIVGGASSCMVNGKVFAVLEMFLIPGKI